MDPNSDHRRMLPQREQVWLNLARSFATHQDGLNGSIGNGNRTEYFRGNTAALFSAAGPLGAFRPIAHGRLQRYVSQVITAARRIFNQDHSNGAGDEHEDIPEWARVLFPLFDGNSQRDNARREQQAIVRGVLGAQAPLGVRGNNNAAPVQLRNERSNNNGDAQLRQRVVGNVNIQHQQVEGRDDAANRRPLDNRRRIAGNRRNRVRHRNIHLNGHGEDDVDNDYAGRRSDDIRYGLQSMRMLVDGIYHGMVEQPRRTVLEVYNDISRLSNERRGAQPDMLRVIDISLSILNTELQELQENAARRMP